MAIPVRRTLALAGAGLLALAGVAVAAQSGAYGGTTSQKQGGSAPRISLIVSRGAVSNVELAALVNQGGGVCAVNVGALSTTFTKAKLRIDGHGSFNGKLSNGQGASLLMSGALKGQTVSGTFVVSSTGGVQGTAVCTSAKIRFTARSGGGQVKHGRYSGTIGPGFPISFRVSADGRSVDSLLVRFEETCNGSPGSASPTFHFKTLAIGSGKFSGTAVDHFGSKVSDALRITGTFFARVATGQVSDTSHIQSLHNCVDTEDFIAAVK